ncbi:MAG: hypothetical protein IT331_07695 [Anaerolineae bacterium]|nr:hypothetical protein [Anaerolineae bacterium]
MYLNLRIFIVLWLALALTMLAACSGKSETPAPSPTTAPATSAAAAPTAVIAATATNPPAVEQTDAPAATDIPSPVSATEVPPASVPTAVPPTDVPAAQAPVNYFGASTYGEIMYNETARALATLAGVQVVRTSVTWGDIEKTRGSFDWDATDHMINTLTEHNFEPLTLILDNPGWASNTLCGPVNDLEGFETFVRELFTRYPRVHYWALYNEPDNAKGAENSSGGCFGGDDLNGNGVPDYQDYAAQLRVAWRALHQVNPQGRLLVGALAYDNFDQASAPPGYPGGGSGGSFNYHFIEQLLDYVRANPLPGGARYFDDVSFNFYAIYGPYWERQVGGVGVSAKANKLRQLLSDYGVSAGLVVSETGANSQSRGDDQQSEFAVKTFTRGLASGIMHMVWWTFQDFPDSNSAPSNTWKFGLIDQAANPKPSYSAYQTMVNQLNGAAFLQPLQVDGGEGYVFTRDGAGKAVVWSSSENPVTLAFSARTLQVVSMYGEIKAITDGSPKDTDPSAGRIGLAVNQFPVYVQVVE